MGARSLESSLRTRLMLLVSIAVMAVGAGSYGVVARVLRKQADDATIGRARDALRMYFAERSEGDSPASAADELLDVAAADGMRVMLVLEDGERRTTHDPFPDALRGLAPGRCAHTTAWGARWRACAQADRGAVAIAAVRVDGDDEALGRIAVLLAGIVLCAITATGLVVRASVRRLLTSLRELAGWSRSIDPRRSDAAPSPPPRDSNFAEVEQLASSFDALVTELLDAIVRERATSAHVAHELRTSLTSIRGQLERESGATVAARALLAEIDAMSRAIDAILLLARPARPLSARTVVNVADIVRELAPPATAVDALPDEALVRGDAALLSLAIRNLLENAALYGGGATAVRLSRADDALELAVIDQGPGIDPRERSRMFDRYWRGQSDSRGSGLGLALVRAVAIAHGGDVRARTGDNGRGLAVSMTIGRVIEWYEDAAPSLGNG